MNKTATSLILAGTLALSGCAFLQSAAGIAAQLAGSQLGMLVLDCAKAQSGITTEAARKAGECIAGPLTWEEGSEAEVADRIYVGQLGLDYADAYDAASAGDRKAARELRKLERQLCEAVPSECEGN